MLLGMEPISDAAKAWLAILVDEYTIELANQAIQSDHVRFQSGPDALRAMVTAAYEKGHMDAISPPPDFAADMQRVQAVNDLARDIAARGGRW